MVPFFLPVKANEPRQDNSRFCLFFPASLGTEFRGSVLYIHPFAEEMNKARRMAAVQARALSNAGFDVLLLDLHGCGDSTGDFGDATWESWVEDVLCGIDWLKEKGGGKFGATECLPFWLWGLRAGCLLAVEAANQCKHPVHFLFWQAPTAGKVLLQQFLRIKLAENMTQGTSKGSMAEIRQHLLKGLPVEIAGYMVSPQLANGLEKAELSPPSCSGKSQRCFWFETSTRENASLNPASATTVARWEDAGYLVSTHVIEGSAFWQSTEIEELPELVLATTKALLASLSMQQ